ncbi:MAG: MarR family transcriptional regulator [Pseudomonadota bacterium]
MSRTGTSQPANTAVAGTRKLSDFLCFAIYSANLAFGKAYKPTLDKLGLTYTQYITVIALWEENHQTVTALGEKLSLESNTLTPILKKLEAMGYLLRQRDPSDERQVLVSLTDEGRRLREKGLDMNLVEATGLSPEEFTKMQKAVVTLRGNLVKAAKGGK